MRPISPHRPSFVLTCALGGVYVAIAVFLRPSARAEDAPCALAGTAPIALARQRTPRGIDATRPQPCEAAPTASPRAASSPERGGPASRQNHLQAAARGSTATAS